jgi:hypothetical protein
VVALGHVFESRAKGLFRVDFLRCTVQRSGGSRRIAAAQQQ